MSLREFLLTNLALEPGSPPRWRVPLDTLRKALPEIRGFSAPENWRAFEGPTLFVHGADSSYVLPEHHAQIRALFPRAEFHSIAGAGHWLHAEKPAEFLQVVTEFLNNRK